MSKDLQYKISMDVSGLKSALSSALSSVSSISGGLQKMASIGRSSISFAADLNQALTLAGSAASALSAAMNKPLTLAGSLEQTTTSIQAMLGSAEAAQKVLSDIRSLALNSNFDMPSLAAAAKQLIAFGVQADDIKPTLSNIADVSGAINAPIGEMADLFGKAKTQGRLFAEDLNQFTGRGVPLIAELARQFDVAESEVKTMTEEGKVGFAELNAAFKSMTDEGGKFYGISAAQAKTYNGLVDKLAETWDDLLISIGAPVANALKPVLEDAIGLAGSIKPIFDQLGQSLATLISSFRDFLGEAGSSGLGAALAKQIKEALSTIGSIISIPFEVVAAGIGDFGSALVGIFAAGARLISDKILITLQKFTADFKIMLGEVISNIPGLSSAGERIKADGEYSKADADRKQIKQSKIDYFSDSFVAAGLYVADGAKKMKGKLDESVALIAATIPPPPKNEIVKTQEPASATYTPKEIIKNNDEYKAIPPPPKNEKSINNNDPIKNKSSIDELAISQANDQIEYAPALSAGASESKVSERMRSKLKGDVVRSMYSTPSLLGGPQEPRSDKVRQMAGVRSAFSTPVRISPPSKKVNETLSTRDRARFATASYANSSNQSMLQAVTKIQASVDRLSAGISKLLVI
jgi:tape measure domain-containing protein